MSMLEKLKGYGLTEKEAKKIINRCSAERNMSGLASYLAFLDLLFDDHKQYPKEDKDYGL